MVLSLLVLSSLCRFIFHIALPFPVLLAVRVSCGAGQDCVPSLTSVFLSSSEVPLFNPARVIWALFNRLVHSILLLFSCCCQLQLQKTPFICAVLYKRVQRQNSNPQFLFYILSKLNILPKSRLAFQTSSIFLQPACFRSLLF